MKIIQRMDAARSGLTRYYTGKPCKHGHDSERFVTNTGCVMCDAERRKRQQQELARIIREARGTANA